MIKGFSADKLPPNGKKIKDNIYHFSNLASEVFSKVSTDKDKIDPAAWKKFTAENCSKQTE